MFEPHDMVVELVDRSLLLSEVRKFVKDEVSKNLRMNNLWRCGGLCGPVGLVDECLTNAQDNIPLANIV